MLTGVHERSLSSETFPAARNVMRSPHTHVTYFAYDIKILRWGSFRNLSSMQVISSSSSLHPRNDLLSLTSPRNLVLCMFESQADEKT